MVPRHLLRCYLTATIQVMARGLAQLVVMILWLRLGELCHRHLLHPVSFTARLYATCRLTTSHESLGVNTNIRFKASPFFKVDQAVSTVVECPGRYWFIQRMSLSDGCIGRIIRGNGSKKSNTLFHTDSGAIGQTFSTQVRLFHAVWIVSHSFLPISPKYQLRLYCTSSTFYMPSSVGFRSVGLCPVEFPATCEVRVNNVQLLANLKGVKKKPGTAPPADLGKSVRSIAGVQNRVEMVYVNSQQPVVPKVLGTFYKFLPPAYSIPEILSCRIFGRGY